MKPRVLFVTGRLAEPALRKVVADLSAVEAEVAVLPITVAALLTCEWVGRKLAVPAGTERVVLPGHCNGDLDALATRFGTPFERGPIDLHDLPEFFGHPKRPSDYGRYDIEILAEINHAPRLSEAALFALAEHFRASGADVIDLGCDPGSSWAGIGNTTRRLVADGYRVSVDSFNPAEVEAALAAGATLVLSENSTNAAWATRFPHAEFVAIPDTPSDAASLNRTVETLGAAGVRVRLDPVLEPIGFGFAASLGRYLEVRHRYPDAEMMMGVGNLTELTEVDSAGVNVLLAGFCQELGIRSVLTTEVANVARSAVKEFDLARRLVAHAVRERVVPKRLEPGLLLLRDRKLASHSEEELAELAARVTDRNYRIFAERGELHILNGKVHLRGTDPFALFAELQSHDAKIGGAHAFYLGYEFAKAVTALTLGKNYAQDRALNWGFLTIPEMSHRTARKPD